MNSRTKWVAGWRVCLLSGCSCALGADVNVGGDLDDMTEEVPVEAVAWEPMIIRMEVFQDATAAIDMPTEKVLVYRDPVKLAGLLVGWRQLEPLIAIHPNGYAAGEQFLSGWRLNPDGNGFERRMAADPRIASIPIHELRFGAKVYFHLSWDIWINASPSQKENRVRLFRVTEWQIDAYHVSDQIDGVDVLKPAPQKPAPGVLDGNMLPSGFVEMEIPPRRNKFENYRRVWDRFVGPGVWEIRTTLTVKPRFRLEEDFGPEKSVSGIIRFAVSPDQKFQPTKISGYDLSNWYPLPKP